MVQVDVVVTERVALQDGRLLQTAATRNMLSSRSANFFGGNAFIRVRQSRALTDDHVVVGALDASTLRSANALLVCVSILGRLLYAA